MVNVVSQNKALAYHRKAFLTNIRHMQEKVAAMKAADMKEEAKINSPVNQEMNHQTERN